MTTRPKSASLILFACLFIVGGALMRVARHYGWIDLPPNVAPVAAMAMFAAVHLPRRLAVLVPLGLMLISDALIGWYAIGVVVTVYVSFGISLLLGWWLRRRGITPGRLVMITLAGSVTFFILTNAAVWMFEEMYTKNLQGLMNAYIAGLPFFRNTVLGDLGYTAVVFGCYQAIMVYWRKRTMVTDSALYHG